MGAVIGFVEIRPQLGHMAAGGRGFLFDDRLIGATAGHTFSVEEGDTAGDDLAAHQIAAPDLRIGVQLSQLPEHPAVVAAELLELQSEGAIVAAHADEDHRCSRCAQRLGALIGVARSGTGAVDGAAGVGVVDAQDTAEMVDDLHPPGQIYISDAGHALHIGVVKYRFLRGVAGEGADGVAQHAEAFAFVISHKGSSLSQDISFSF